jgi:hypothetical protein
MNPIAEGLARAVLANFPYALCFRCLALQQGLSEHDARAATLVLVARDDFMIVREGCHSCQRIEELLVFEKPGEAARDG